MRTGARSAPAAWRTSLGAGRGGRGRASPVAASLSAAPARALATALLVAVGAASARPLAAQAAAAGPAGPGDPRPPVWAGEGVPDTVVALVEASATAPDDDRGKALLREAEALAREHLAGDPADVDRRFTLAVVLGLRAQREGGRTKVRAAAELHEILEGILAAEPEHARAHHLLGRIHAGVQRMSGVVRWIATHLLGGGALDDASWEKAEVHLRFAEERAPEVPDHHLQLANLYEDTGRPARALEEVRHALALPAASALDRAVRAEALELKRTLEGRGTSPGGSRP